jgi:hypothetical protein
MEMTIATVGLSMKNFATVTTSASRV